MPEGHKGKLLVSFSKKQPDRLFSTKRTLSILSRSREKQVAYFQCEPTGEFLFELKSRSSSNISVPRSSKSLGYCSLSLQEFWASGTQLSVDKWLTVVPGIANSGPILLHVAVSFTIPTPGSLVFDLIRPQPFLKNPCFLPLPGSKKFQQGKTWTRIIDDGGNDVVSLQMRY